MALPMFGNLKKTIILTFVIYLSLFFDVRAAQVPAGFADLSEKLIPAVVNISTTQNIKVKDKGDGDTESPLKQLPPGHPLEEFKDFFDKFYRQYGDEDFSERNSVSLGSGFVISPDGLIVTNNHVIADAEEITIIFADDSKYKAETVGRDTKTDLALLQIKADKKLPYVQFGDSDEARVGDWVIAIGNPFGLGGTVTAGIISARARDINSGPFDDFIQTDAAINRGNSGGPMFNMDGKVIGINTAIYSPTGGSVGIGFAVPAALAQPIIEELKENGKIERGWIGVKIQNVTDEIGESVGLDKSKGALVVDVNKGSPAEKAGIIPGDIIIKFNDKEVSVMKKLPRFVAETKIGKEVDIEVWRSGKSKKLSIKIGEQSEAEEKKSEEEEDGKPVETPEGDNISGLVVTPLSKELREQFGYDSELRGLLIVGVTKSNLKKHLKKGDVIIMVSQNKVSSVEDFEKEVKIAKENKRKSVLLQVYRLGDTAFVPMPID